MREKLGFFICALLILQCGNGLAKEERYSLRLTSLGWFHQIPIVGVGVPQHGGTIVGTVIYPKANPEACYPFDKFGISFKSRPGFPTRVLLVDRGDCFFALKAWNAQKAGAAAILVADYWDEPLTTMDTPEEDYFSAKYLQNITIPSVLITKELGDKIKKAISSGEMVNINLKWRESILNPDERVEYEFWTNSNDDRQIEFVKNFKGAAQILEQKGYTRFTPHYMTWYCPEAFILSKNCRSQCINHGRYCSPDPQQDFSAGYDGKDVVVQNLCQACLFKVANESGKPWLWWDYVTDFANRCPMKQNKYTKGCADQVIRSLGVDISKIDECIGDVEADVNNPVLEAEQEAQIGKGSRGDVTMLPTLVINNRKYRGKLEKGAVLKAICAGFEETEEPAICFRQDIEADKLLQRTYESFQGSETLQRTYESFQGAEPLQSNKETYESLQNNAADAQPLQDNMETYVAW